MANLKTIIKGLQLANPILAGPGPNVATAADAVAAVKGGAAAMVLQTVTVEPGARAQAGRVTYGKDGAFHREPCTAIPFDIWLTREFTPALNAARKAGVPLIPSIGYRADEVRQMGAKLAAAGADALILDTHHAEREQILPALTGLKTELSIPVIVRLAPNHGEDLADLASELESVADAFCVIGSFGPNLLLDVDRGGAALDGHHGLGFLSGAPIRPIAQRFVFELARKVAKPIIAAGGVISGQDVVEFMMLGATAVMVSTHAVAKGPAVYGQIARELGAWLTSHGHDHVGEIYRAYIRKYAHGQRIVTEKEECPQLIAEKCIRCTFCETVCFYDAIKAPPRTLPTITYAPCFECGLCVSACPTDALKFRPRDQLTLISLEGA